MRNDPDSIVFLAHFNWDTPFIQFHKELLRGFAKLGWKSLWVDSPFNPRRDLGSWIRHFPDGRLTEEGSVWRYTPWSVPGIRVGERFPLPHEIVARGLREVFRRLDLRRPVVLACTPVERQILRAIPHGTTAYWTGDEVSLPGENVLLEYVDIILAVSPTARDLKQRDYPTKTFEVSTGVAFAKYNAALRSPVEPEDMRGLKRPIIGYAGSVAEFRMDLDLLSWLVQRRPDASFVVVGGMDAEACAFFARHTAPNLHVLGSKPYDQVPHYIKMFDVGLIPYRLTTFNLGCNPLKFYEYSALGKPVVATPIPALQRFAPVAALAAEREAFNRGIDAMLAEKDDPVRVEERLAIARNHSADAIARNISLIVRQIDHRRGF